MAEIEETSTPEEETNKNEDLTRRRWTLAGIIAGLVILVAGIVVAVILLANHPTVASNVRDIFIIFLALESLLIGAALVILIIQMAGLINLLRNEVRPILDSTSETVNTLRGTTEFLSQNLVEPVIKLNSYLAGLKKVLDLIGIIRK